VIDLIASATERLGLTPMHVVAAALGLIISWGATQACKVGFHLAGRAARILAFMLGFAATYTTAPGWGWPEFWIAIAVGLTAPTAYKAMIMIARSRGWAWADALSGDRAGR